MSTNHQLSDRELLERVTGGDEDAFRALYSRFWRKLYGAAFKRLPEHEVVKDVLQDVFLNLWSRRAELDISNIEAYLMTAVRNRIFKYLEQEGRYTPLETIFAELTMQSTAHADALVLRNQLLQTYEALVNQLPPAQRQIVKLRFEDDLSTEEIAQLLDISRKTVQNQLRTALIHIRSTLMTLVILSIFKNL